MNAASTERDFIPYPTNRVVGTVGDAGKTQAATDALLQAGFHREDIEILHGEEDLKRLDRAGAEPGFLAQFQRRVIRAFEAFEEFRHVAHHLEDIRAGRFVIMVLAKRRVQRMVAADILNRYGARFVGFYGRWAWEALPAPPHITPQEIPALFARACNERDPDALASLFDEDAEFVGVTGLCCHDRESIRQAHALIARSQLAIEETRVRLLTPDIAVVHARMTLSGGAPADGVGPPGPRTTIASFVVHRSLDRWMCASAQTTDVIPTLEASIIEEAGMFRPADRPGGHVS